METDNTQNTEPEGLPSEGQPTEQQEQQEQWEQQEPPQEPFLTPQSVQAEIRSTRHRKEIPLYITCIVIGVISSFSVMMNSLKKEGMIDQIKEVIMDGSITGDPGTAQAAIWLVMTILGFVMGIGSIIAMIVIMLVALYREYGLQMSYSIRVSETNFPEIYAKVQEYSRLLGIKEPEVYVQQMNGNLNAFTSWIPGRTFIQLNSEIVDIAYLENKDFDTVYFVMAHEFGHIYLHHVQLKYTFWNVLVNFLPVIGSAVLLPLLSRAREYSADRVGQALTAGKAERECMMLLGAGRHLYKHVDIDQYLNEITGRHNAFERLARWVTNFMASHPIMPYRTKAILDPQKRSGRLL